MNWEFKRCPEDSNGKEGLILESDVIYIIEPKLR